MRDVTVTLPDRAGAVLAALVDAEAPRSLFELAELTNMPGDRPEFRVEEQILTLDGMNLTRRLGGPLRNVWPPKWEATAAGREAIAAARQDGGPADA